MTLQACQKGQPERGLIANGPHQKVELMTMMVMMMLKMVMMMMLMLKMVMMMMMMTMMMTSQEMVIKRGKLKALMAEREALVAVDSPWLVRLHYAFQDDHSLHMVMDFMPGEWISAIPVVGMYATPSHLSSYVSGYAP
jgi:hypothetical protein